MKETPTQCQADDCCMDCGKGISPHQADNSKQRSVKSRDLCDSHNREGVTLCRNHLDKETRDSRTAANGRTEVSL